jgi:two-component system response regulator DesR
LISVLIADNQTAVREAFAAILNLQEGIKVVATASTAREAVNLAWLHQPDVVLVDVDMADGNGFAVVEQLNDSVPISRSIMLSAVDRPGYVSRAVELGTWALLTKTIPFAEIIHSIREVHAGKRLIGPNSMDEDGQSPLSARETEVLRVAARVGSTVDIAQEMHLSQGTVNNYISSILAKLGAASRIQAVVLAQDNGWL